ncbi:MAG: prolyl oligopeptidase family serine peptidase [Bacteroidales bacterium]|nr:prolyl oligopeptidase family serine peptidase [Bacteroidales bacterium]
MKHHTIIVAMILVLLSCNRNRIMYPVTKKVDVIDDYFGVKVADPYRWLECDTCADVSLWIDEQNKVTFQYLSNIPFREKLKKRLTELFNFARQSAPFKIGSNYFYFKNNGLQNQSVLYITQNPKEPGKVLLDPNTFSVDGTIALTNIKISPDGKILAYAISKSGSDWNEIYFKNIATGELIKDTLKWVKFSGIAWFQDGIFYSGYTPPKKGQELSQSNTYHKLFYHRIGNPQKEDVIVLENPNEPLQNFYAYTTSDDNILCISSSKAGQLGNALSFMDLNQTKPTIRTIFDTYHIDYDVIDHHQGFLYIKTNSEANNYKIIRVSLNDPKKIETIIPETNAVIKHATLTKSHIVVNFMKDAQSVVKVFTLDGKYLYDIALPTIGTVNSLNSTTYDNELFYDFTSFNYPTSIFRINTDNQHQQELIFSPKIDFNPNEYEVKQVFFESKDKTKVPMFIVYKKGIQLNGKNPTLLYGYGGFNISLMPSFSATRLAWLEQGGIFAMANLRGGGEYGESWHLAGTKLKKQNVFDDFIAAAEYLISNNYTNPNYLAIQGGSNGGLLVGAVINQRPELFRVALPAVGVMDMLRFHKFTIGWSWVTDYGSSDNKEEFEALYKYSPLHNIQENVEYPSVLVTTADHDDRVVPAHSFKYIATLQEKYKGNRPMLIRIERKAGHGSGKPTTKVIEETTDIFAFTFYEMGIEPKFKTE